MGWKKDCEDHQHAWRLEPGVIQVGVTGKKCEVSGFIAKWNYHVSWPEYGHRALATGHRSLVTRHWSQGTGHRALVIGHLTQGTDPRALVTKV